MPGRAVILNAGAGAWAFEEHAERLSRAFGVPVSETPAEPMYVLSWDEERPPGGGRSFIPWSAVQAAADKRQLARRFAAAGVDVPTTHLCDTPEQVERIVRSERATEWVLKWPVGCGGSGHRLVQVGDEIPGDWPRPYVLQEFIRMLRPEVYRLFGVAGELFGWNVRRYPAGTAPSPWVAHARGARYESAGEPPQAAVTAARRALEAVGLLGSFGCADLIPRPTGRWLVLEVGTDGVFNHVDRQIGIAGLADELDRRLADAFRAWAASEAVGL